MEKNICGIYLLYGEEQFLLEQYLKKIKKEFGKCVKGINYITINDTNANKIIPNIETPAFGYENKLIIAKNTGLFQTEGKQKNVQLVKTKEELNQYLKENEKMIKNNTILIFIEENVDTRLALYKTISKIGEVKKFEYQKPMQLVNTLQTMCKKYSVTIDNNTAMYFIECCGTNLMELINEIRKLIEYIGKDGTITKKEIDLLSTKKIESIVFDLTDTIGQNNGKSIQILDDLLFMKEPIQKIIVIIYNHIKKIYYTKLAQKTGKNIAVTLGLKPNQTFLTNKYAKQAQQFKEADLKKILQEIHDLDYKYKIGLIDAEIGLKTILCAY